MLPRTGWVGVPKLSLSPGAGNPRYATAWSVVCFLQSAFRQNRRQKVVNKVALRLRRGALRSCRGLDISNLTKLLQTFSVSDFNVGGLGALFKGAKPNKAPPWRRHCFQVCCCNLLLLIKMLFEIYVVVFNLVQTSTKKFLFNFAWYWNVAFLLYRTFCFLQASQRFFHIAVNLFSSVHSHSQWLLGRFSSRHDRLPVILIPTVS